MAAHDYPTPANEARRQRAVERYGVLDTLPESFYDDCATLAASICGTSIALVSLLDNDRQWFKAHIGLDRAETPRADAFCAHAIMDPSEPLVVQDATADARFSDNPLVTGDPKIRFYAGASLVTPDGHALGTLCVIDREPRTISASQLDALSALSRTVVAHLEARRSVASLEELVLKRYDYVVQLTATNRVLKKEASRLEAMSLLDPLTRVGNRRACEDRLDSEHSESRRSGHSYAVLMVDIDRFKQMNDSQGHVFGDEVLVAVATLLGSALRPSDFLGRYGGDEFVVILPSTDASGALVIAERMRRIVETATWRTPVTVSVGAAALLASDRTYQDLVERADAALYASKAAGRNSVTGPDGLNDE